MMTTRGSIRNDTEHSVFPCKIKRTSNGSQYRKELSSANNGFRHGVLTKKNDEISSEPISGSSRSQDEKLKSCRQLHEEVEDKVMQSASKVGRIKECIQKSISEESKRKISLILSEVLQLSDVEKLLLYLQLPTGANPEVDPLKLKVPGNPLGKKADAEVAQTYTWIQSHLEEDHEVSLPKQEVYDEYKMFCDDNKIDPLCAADFGKVMKHIFPSVKPRRLGTRGNSRYCYSGLRKKLVVEIPSLPDLDISSESAQTKSSQDEEIVSAASHLIYEWAEKLLGKRFSTLKELSCYLIENLYVDTRSVAAFTILSSSNHTTSKGHNAASLLKNAGGNRRRETQLHLQRKLQEKELIKEQKKKLVEQRSLLSSRKNSFSSRSKSLKKEEPAAQQQQCANDNQPKDAQPVEEKTTENVKRCSSEEITRRAKKVPIPRNSSAVHFPQTRFIILPSIQPAVTLSSPTKPSPSQQKYKRIQPKPSLSPGLSTSLLKDETSSARVFAIESSDGEKSERSSPLQHVFLGGSTLSEIHSDSENASKDSPQADLDAGAIQSQSKRPSEESNPRLSKRLHSGSGNTTSSGSLSPWSRMEQPGNDVQVKEEVSIRQLETDALLEYLQDSCDLLASEKATTASSTATTNTAQLSQLRLLLERNLPQRAIKSSVSEEGVSGYSELRQALLRDNRTCFRSKSMLEKSSLEFGWSHEPAHSIIGEENLMKDVPQLEAIEGCSQEYASYEGPTNDSINMSDGILSENTISDSTALTSHLDPNLQDAFIAGGNYLADLQKQNEAARNSTYTQIPSVPPSPNTRRRAFNFLPISPRQTPVPENLAYVSSPVPQQMCASSSLASSLVSIAVGPSQPPSTATSPFVSPRSTPVPISRSRHNSGQSAYSTPRQTPCQNFDSGVSSISTSPFVSPQSTPVPISRLRHNSSHSQGKSVTFCTTQTFARPRRNSGPGGPPLIPSQFASSRSAPLSPLVGECFTQTAFTFPTVGETASHRAQQNSTSNTPMSPVSPKHCEGSCDNVAEETLDDRSKPWSSECKLPSVTLLKGNWPPHLWTSKRSRHVSGSVIHHRPVGSAISDPLATEIQNYLQDGVSESTESSASNRSRSVPLNQMVRNLMVQFSAPDGSISDEVCQVRSPFVSDSNVGSENADVLVSEWGLTSRRNLNELLDQPPVEDDLQTTLEDLRDVDNDFSKLLAQELEQMDQNGEYS